MSRLSVIPHWPWRRVLSLFVILALGGVMPATVGAAEKAAEADVPDLSITTRWRRRIYTDTGVQNRPVEFQTVAGKRVNALPADLPAGGEYYTEPSKPLGSHDLLHLDLRLPTDFPQQALIYVWVKDWDDFWYQAQVTPRPIAGQPTDDDATSRLMRVSVPLTGVAATEAWRPGRGHHRPWNQLSPDQIEELGLKFASPTGKPIDYQGDVGLLAVTAEHLPADKRPVDQIQDLRLLTKEPRVGEPIELAMWLSHHFRKPFDREQVDLRAVITGPDDEETEVRAFYFADFLFDESSDRSKLTPYGQPNFRVRYTPLKPGKHTIQLAGTIGEQVVKPPALTLDVAKAHASWQGFVRRHPEDFRLLSYSRSGQEFQGIGMNVRSPYDTRYMEAFAFSEWEQYNLTMYKRLFERYQQAGINVVEVWMSPWWLALEWMPDAPGNHGVGHYNQFRAWKLDRLFQWAAEYDIYLVLVFNNHGKFSAWCDPDWQRNPYNKERNGTLESPEDYFSDSAARASTKQLLDYIVARWGHEPHLLAYKLFTEIDLTGTNSNWYKGVQVQNWHHEMAAYLKSRDPNEHLVTTHWSTTYQKAQASPELAKTETLDMLTLDIYYSGVGANQLWNYMQQTLNYMQDIKKPCIITEFGGSPWADSLDHIRNQLHIAQWSGWFGVMATPPYFWWFPLVEEQNLYGSYAALRQFIDGESRVNAKSTIYQMSETPLQVMQLDREDGQLLWLFDSQFYFAGDLNRLPSTYTDLRLPLRNLPVGDYAIEYWNPRTGEKIAYDRLEHSTAGGSGLTLPQFEKDIAIKITKVTR